MRAALLSFGVLAFALVACGRRGGQEATTTVTAAEVGPPPTPSEVATLRLGATSERIAREVCEHEARCEHADLGGCFDVAFDRARSELMRWNCEPAATRARLKDCLAGIENQPCTVDLRTERESLCPVNVECDDQPGRLIAPGTVLPEAWQP